jgi:hypothetical protein
MKRSFLVFGLCFLVCLEAIAAAPLTESTFTEIIREAKVLAAADKSVVPAQTNMVFQAPDRVRTGAASRVEMTARDKTITRIGANTIFTFEAGGRNIQLEKGSLLFHSPAGAGGGTIRHRGTAAAVLGTTMICAVLPDGSFKVLCLEGEVKVTLSDGRFVMLKAGEMVTVPPDENSFGPVETFSIEQAISSLLLVVGFSNPLSSLPLIKAAMQEQNARIADGTIKFVVPFNRVASGLDVIFRPTDSGLPSLLQLSDRTILNLSPVQP